jgi:mono/diheme cytochrome c family protein
MTTSRGVLGAAVLALLQGGAAADDGLLERGSYLERAIVACGNCHTPMGPDGPLPGMELAGGLEIPEPGLFTVYTPNITPDPETGIGGWSDEELIRAIREGVRPDGTIIRPPMPMHFYRVMSDGDVRAIVAYLRSVPPVRNEVPESVYHVPTPASWGPPVGSVPDPDPGDIVAHGAYLAGPLGHCMECHTPMVDGRQDLERDLGRGGFAFHGPWGTSVSRNITPHPEDGIGALTDEEVKRAITEGIGADGERLMPPMAYYAYANMTERDLDAVVAYLRSLPPLPDP